KLSAQVMAVARDVRELPTPVPWRSASEGDVLLERDALRTAKSASARLRFDDGATVTLSEDSLVFIRRQVSATSALPKKEIEVQIGQIDVEGTPAGAAAPGKPAAAGRARTDPDAIEIVVAGARSVASAEQGKPLSTRSRRGTDNLAQFMVFAGKSTVSAAGASIEVPAGSGTSVVAKAKPGPVEALLPAPAGARPAYGEEVEQGAPQFSWSAVPGAHHYTVEVCRDPGCGSVVAREAAVATAAVQLDVAGGLPAGELFWRVTAVASSGLDGFPTPPIRVEAVEAVRPNAPNLSLNTPAGAAVSAGSCLSHQPEPVVRAVDRHGADLPWTLLLDGKEIALDDYRRQSLAGEHQLSARVTDARGRSTDSAQVAFTVDAAAPWIDLVASSSGKVAETSEGDRRSGSRKRSRAPEPVGACDSGLELLDAAQTWQPVPCATSGAGPAAAILTLPLSEPSVRLRTTGSAVGLGEDPANVVAAGMPAVTLGAWDVGCGVTQVALRIVPSRYRSGRMVLEAEVSDGAGNRRTAAWHIARR
ncbi:MAG: hypothetical protein ABIV06_00235, partial [Thermoanaerobaculia bacterium]